MSGPFTDVSILAWVGRVLAAVAGFYLGRALDARLLPNLAEHAGHPSEPRWRRAGRSRRVGYLTATAFFACCCLRAPAEAAAGCVLLLGLIGGAVIDGDHMIIPDLFTVGLAAVGVALSVLIPPLHIPGGFLLLHGLRSGGAALLGLLVGSSLALWLGIVAEFVLGREALGFGDVKLLGAIGAFCGWQGAVFALFGGAVIGMIYCGFSAARRWVVVRVAGPSYVSERGAIGLGTPFPFGPMLATAAGLYFLVLHPWADRYLNQYLVFF